MTQSRALYLLNMPNGIQIEFVKVFAGSFLMGSADSDCQGVINDNPQRPVTLDDYWIGRYPITDSQFFIFWNETRGHRPEHWDQMKINPARMTTPVVNVTGNEAAAFCEWLSLASNRKVRLPTEEEWEFAARGADGRCYPWGNRWDPSCCNGNNPGTTGRVQPVGSTSPAGDSPCGAADMAGNTWEWTSSPYAGWTQRLVARGGCYSSPADQCRSTYRYNLEPVYRGSTVGFRVVMEYPSQYPFIENLMD